MARLILIADDSPTIQKKVQLILKGEGFEVETVSNGVAAIKKLLLLQPALVLADVSMPGKDGYEVCEYVKSSADFHHVPVLLVASDLEPYDEQRGVRAGADGLLKKPFDSQDLIAAVERFASQDETASPAATLLDTAFRAPLEAGPAEPEPEEVKEKQERDWSALSSGMAFAEPQAEQTPAAEHVPEPLPEIPLQPLPDSAPETSPESAQGSSLEPGFEIPAEVPAAPALNVAPAAVPAASEPFAETPLEVAPELAAESTQDEVPEPEPAIAEPVFETAPAPAAWSEVAMVVPEPGSEESRPPAGTLDDVIPTLDIEEPPLPSGPILLEEPMEPVSEASLVPEQGEPPAETTVAFHVPAGILEPVLHDDFAPAPPAADPLPSVQEQHPEPRAANSLDSFSLAEAWEEQVGFAPAEAESPVEQAPTVAQPAEAAEAVPASEPERVQTIVRKAVLKMAPPALSPEAVEELVRKVTEEITAELRTESSQTQ